MIKTWFAQLKLSTILLAIAMVAGTAIGARAATASWDPNTEPDLAGYKLSYGTQPGVHTVVLDVGKVTTHQFNPAPGLRYYVVVQAYNTAGELSEKSAEVIVDIPVPNLPPVLAQPGNQTSTVNANVSLALNASDPEGKALTFTATGLPPGLSISSSALTSSAPLISGRTRTAGSYQVTVTVSDGLLSASRSFSWTVVAGSNLPPVLAQPADQTSPLNANVSMPLSASDPQGKPLTFTATGLPPGLSIAGVSGLISGTTRAAGVYQVTVSVSNGAASASRNFRWSVGGDPTRSAPNRNDVDSPQAPPSEDPDENTNPSALQDYVGVPGDFDGDGRQDLATYRVSSGEWRIWTSGTNFIKATRFVWGEAGDRPMPADYNGDRITDLAIYRPSTGTWHLSLSGTQTPLAVQWGGPEDSPVAIDHDGDGKADLALIRNGGYEILLSSANYVKSVQVQ